MTTLRGLLLRYRVVLILVAVILVLTLATGGSFVHDDPTPSIPGLGS